MAEELKFRVKADVSDAVQGLGQAKDKLDQVGRAAGKTGSDLGKAGDVAKKSTRDYTGLSRVLQDLPFGFIAISNNLTQLLPAAGAAGLAFSALVSGITFAQTGLANWTRGLSGSKKGLDENTVALTKFANALDEASNKVKNLQSELDFMNRLGKLRLDIAFGKGLTTDLKDLQAQSVEQRQFTKTLEDQITDLKNARNKILSYLTPQLTGDQLALFDQGVLKSDNEGLNDVVKWILEIYEGYTDRIKELSQQQVESNRQQSILYAEIAQKKIDIEEDAQKKLEEQRKKAEARRKKELEDLKDFYEKLFSMRVGKIDARVMSNADDRATRTRIGLSYLRPTRTNIVGEEATTDIDQIIDKMDDMIAKSALASLAVNGIGDAFAAMGQSFIEGGNGIKTFFSTLRSALASIVGQLLKTAILAGILSAVTGGTGAGGLSFVKAFKNLLGGSIKGFAKGGLVYGDTLARVGEGSGTSRTNPEVIAPLDMLKKYIGGGQKFPDYLPVIEWRGDSFRAFYANAQKQGRFYI